MKRLLRLFVVIVLISQIQLVDAEECTNEQINNLKELANTILVDVEFDYDAVEVGYFDRNIVTIQNLPSDLYIKSNDNSISFFSSEAVDGIITDEVYSNTKSFKVYSNTCKGIILRKIDLDVKQYNLYSEYKECEDIDGAELEVCDEFYSDSLTYDEFAKIINDYKTRKNTITEKVQKSLSDYYGYMIIGGVVLVLIIVLLIIRNRKHSKLD